MFETEELKMIVSTSSGTPTLTKPAKLLMTVIAMKVSDHDVANGALIF